MMNWSLFQYKDVVVSFLDGCSIEMYEILLRRLDILSEKGNLCRRPISSPLRDGFFELRGKANNKEARLLFYFKPNRIIVFVHAIYKAGSAISRHDMEIAKRNKKIIEERKESAYGLNLTH